MSQSIATNPKIMNIAPTTACLVQKQAPDANRNIAAITVRSPCVSRTIATVPLLHIQRRFDNSAVIS